MSNIIDLEGKLAGITLSNSAPDFVGSLFVKVGWPRAYAESQVLLYRGSAIRTDLQGRR